MSIQCSLKQISAPKLGNNIVLVLIVLLVFVVIAIFVVVLVFAVVGLLLDIVVTIFAVGGDV